ncbi:hypothetical protein DL93DRAFT_2087194 [Clavulina sp. PMI_390]|nr:hypothetical protein DL93DRAFT_2087194 [Clavulina sp. PMI_390]
MRFSKAIASTFLLSSLTMVMADTCASINADLAVLGVVFGQLNICLCLADIVNLANIDSSVIQNAVGSVGGTAVSAELEILIVSGPSVTSCPKGSTPSSRKRSPAEVARANHQCEFGLTKCGVYSGIPSSSPTKSRPTLSALSAYECIETAFNLESCGGCVIPYTLGLTPYEIAELPVGVDCTAMEGVSDVECRMGRCIVHKCKKGFKRAAVLQDDGEASFDCVPMTKQTSSIVDSLHQQIGGVLSWRKD